MDKEKKRQKEKLLHYYDHNNNNNNNYYSFQDFYMIVGVSIKGHARCTKSDF